MNYERYHAKKESLEKLASILGIASVFLGITYMPFFSIPLGCFAILLALLSKGYSHKLSRQQITAIATALVAVFLSVATTAKALNAFYTNEEYRNNVTTMFEELYGDTYSELYGEDISSLWNRVVPKGDN